MGEAICRTGGGDCARALEMGRERFGSLNLVGMFVQIGLHVAFSMAGWMMMVMRYRNNE